MKPIHRLLIAFLLLLAPTLSAQAPAATSFGVAGFTFTTPDGWQNIPTTSPMRLAELSCPGDAGAAQVTFFSFGPGQGGGVEPNIQRWLSQFAESPEDTKAERVERKAGDFTYHLVRANGTFLSGMPGQPTTPVKDHALLGAIIVSPNGDVFVKMTGPKETVQKGTDAFIGMIEAAAKTGLSKSTP